jgi:hypothetical protein
MIDHKPRIFDIDLTMIDAKSGMIEQLPNLRNVKKRAGETRRTFPARKV